MLDCLFLVGVVYMIFCLIFYKIKLDLESISPYECGFEPKSLTRLIFSNRFFLICILFIIFDVELSLMLPVPFLVGEKLGVLVFLFFILILILGLIYEYYQGSLEWMNNFVSKA